MSPGGWKSFEVLFLEKAIGTVMAQGSSKGVERREENRPNCKLAFFLFPLEGEDSSSSSHLAAHLIGAAEKL